MEATLLDRALLMERVGEDEGLLLEITDAFLQESVPMLEQLQRMVDEGNIKNVERLAHTLKGSISIFGIDSVTGAALKLEEAGRSGGAEKLQSLCQDLKVEHSRLVQELVELRKTLPNSSPATDASGL
jgi:HPt (histidine-containing phosphotransfer) domain-containing protein